MYLSIYLLEDKLKELRIKWKENPEMRELIMRQVKALKYSQQTKNKSEKFVSDVIDSLM